MQRSVVISFIEALRKYQGYSITILQKLFWTPSTNTKFNLTLRENPSNRIRSYISDLNVTVPTKALNPTTNDGKVLLTIIVRSDL